MFINAGGWLNNTGGLAVAVEPLSVTAGILALGVVLAVALGFIAADAIRQSRTPSRPVAQRLRNRAIHLVLICQA